MVASLKKYFYEFDKRSYKMLIFFLNLILLNIFYIIYFYLTSIPSDRVETIKICEAGLASCAFSVILAFSGAFIIEYGIKKYKI